MVGSVMSLLSDLCVLSASRAAVALDARASAGELCDPDELRTLSRLLQLCALELERASGASSRELTGSAEHSSLEAAQRDANIVNDARRIRASWR